MHRALELRHRYYPVSALLGVATLSTMLVGCAGAESATPAELCAALHQLDATAAALPPIAASATPVGRQNLSYDLGEDVESAREITQREADARRRTLAYPALAAGDTATFALRNELPGAYESTLANLHLVSATASDELGCAEARPRTYLAETPNGR